MAILRYGNNLCVEFDLGDGIEAYELGVPRGVPLDNLAVATAAALNEPIDYPNFSQSTTPGDRIALVVDPDVPQAGHVASAVIRALVEAGVQPDGISVLQNPADPGDEDFSRMIEEPYREQVTFLTHDPADRRQLAYLAAGESGEAILVHRALHDADVVLPIGCLRAPGTAGYFGIHSPVFPEFSDEKTIRRFRGFQSLNGRRKHNRQLTAEVDHVAWQLGVNFTIQIVPAAGDRALHVLAGQCESVRRQGVELYRNAWQWSDVARADLVVAAIEGPARQQTWENVARSLQAAENFVADDGAIAVCCDISAEPGPALQLLATAESPQSALRQAGKQGMIDALAALQLARTLERHKVYLLSGLDPEAVEELNVISIAAPDELVRLAGNHASCVLLSNAPYVTVRDER
jgi:lactate racemase